MFGTLPSPCGPGSATGATDQGVTNTAIHIAYGDDRGFAAQPGLDKEMGDAVKAMIKWCNDQGGILGRQVVGDYYDAAITQVNSVMQQACKTDFMLVGEGFATALSAAWGKPALGIHHLEGHLLAPLLEPRSPAFPFLALLVSGGHTQLVDVEALGRYRILGETLDDAAGEAFDKTAKLLGLPYPGGAALASLAERGRSGEFVFPRPMLDRPGLDFSFSGLKTAALVALRGRELSDSVRADVARGFEEAVIETLAEKCRRALQQTGHRRLVVAGGVGANRRLRERLATIVRDSNAELYFPRAEFCTDNGAMIALAGCMRLAAGMRGGMGMSAQANWELESLHG